MAIDSDSSFFEFIPRGSDLSSTRPESARASAAQAAKIEACREDFLTHVGLSTDRLRERYARLCSKPSFVIQEGPTISQPNAIFSLLSDRITLFSDSYADFMRNHKFFKDQSTKIDTDPERRAVICAQCAWDRYCSSFAARDENERDIFIQSAVLLDQHRRSHRNSIHFYRKKLFLVNEQAPEGAEATALLTTLQSWVPDIPLREDMAIRFSIFYFADFFCAQYRDENLSKKEAGHYHPKYTAGDYIAYCRFADENDLLIALFQNARDWLKQHDFPFSTGERCAAYSLDEVAVKQVHAALKRHLICSRSTVTSPSIDRVREVLQQACAGGSNAAYAAFRFVVFCIVYNGSCFSMKKTRELDISHVFSFCSQVYRKRLTVASQRTSRLRLLLAVCAALHMSSEQINENLLFFLKYHGCVIQSEEEANIWKGALIYYGLLGSPCSLALRCYHHLADCMPLFPKSLYCYQSCSQLHLGGFLAFWGKFSDDLSAKSKYISHIPDELIQIYLQNWGSDKPDVRAVQKACQAASASFQETVPMQAWIEKWDSDSRNGKHKVPYPIDRKELRALSLEYAVQCACVKKARQILEDKLATLFT